MLWLESNSGGSFVWHESAGWVEFPLHELGEMRPPPGDPFRKPRRLTLLSRMKQVWQAARAVGVEVVITVEGDDKLTATQVNAKKMDDPSIEIDTPEQLRRLI
jgi:hypothetical protein